MSNIQVGLTSYGIHAKIKNKHLYVSTLFNRVSKSVEFCGENKLSNIHSI